MKIKKPTYAETIKKRYTKHVRIPDINVIKKSRGGLDIYRTRD